VWKKTKLVKQTLELPFLFPQILLMAHFTLIEVPSWQRTDWDAKLQPNDIWIIWEGLFIISSTDIYWLLLCTCVKTNNKKESVWLIIIFFFFTSIGPIRIIIECCSHRATCTSFFPPLLLFTTKPGAEEPPTSQLSFQIMMMKKKHFFSNAHASLHYFDSGCERSIFFLLFI